MKEARIRLANACDFFEYVPSDDDHSESESEKSDNEDKEDKKEKTDDKKEDKSASSGSDSEGGVDPSEYDL